MRKPKPDSAEWWRQVAQGLAVSVFDLRSELDTLCQAIEGHRGGALTNDGLWHYHEKARACLQREAK